MSALLATSPSVLRDRYCFVAIKNNTCTKAVHRRLEARRRWLRRVVASSPRWSPSSKEAPTGAASGGRGDGNPDVDWEGLQRHFEAAAAGVASELRGPASPLHKKTKGEALGVRHGIGKLGEEANEAGDVEVHRKM